MTRPWHEVMKEARAKDVYSLVSEAYRLGQQTNRQAVINALTKLIDGELENNQ